jgi:hypothetical protein
MEAVLAHPFPLIRGGGLFLICVGLGFLLGWFYSRYWIALAITGFVAGFIASALSPLLQPSLGRPTWVQIAALVIAIVVEMFLIWYVVTRYSDGGERALILSILLVVGLHFIIMGLAHGPLMTLLGIITVINALIGLRIAKSVSITVFGIIDSVLKIAFGLWMLVLYPTFTFW